MARKTNYDYEKRQKELARQKKRDEKRNRKIKPPAQADIEDENE